MNVLETVQATLAGWPQPRLDGASVVVPTLCLYPSNAVVNVYIDGGEREFMVHDSGNAIEQLHAAIGMVTVPNSFIFSTARRRGVSVGRSDGSLFVKGVAVDGLMGAIALVANASTDVAHHLIDFYRPPPRRPLSDEIETILDTRFPSQWRKEEPIIGKSEKRHHFDYVVNLDGKRLLLDLVKPDASSVNAAVVSHLDVENANPHAYIHRAIYDDSERWPAASLALLRVATTPVARSAANDALARLAA